jgi:hypothetical protein
MLDQCPFNPARCVSDAVGGAVGGAVRWGVDGFADALREGAEWVMRSTVGWWLNIPSIDLASSPAGRIRSLVMAVSALVAVAGLMWGGIRMAVTRRGDVAWDMGSGLVRLAAVAALAFALPQLLLNFGDSFSGWALDSAVSGSVADRMIGLARMTGVTAPGAVIFAAMLMILAGVAQAVLMFLREGAIVILSGVLILAAAGGFNPATKGWFPKVSGWLVGLILYKPFAALTYAVAFYMIGDDTGDPRTVFVGLTMLLLSVVALPVMIRFFSWAAPAAVQAGSGLGGAAAAIGGVGVAAMSMRSAVAGGGTATDQANRVRSDLGPVIPRHAGAGSTGTPPARPPAGTGPAPVADGAGTPAPTAGAASSAATSTTSPASAGPGPAGAALFLTMAAKDAANAAKDKAAGAMGADQPHDGEGENR